MYKTNTTMTYDQDLRYMDTGALGNIYASEAFINSNDIGPNGEGVPLSVPALYQAALMQSLEYKLGALDLWDNVKIPCLERLDASLADADGWINFTTPTAAVESYSSLLGLPIVNIPKAGVVEFSVESAYVVLAPPSEFTKKPQYKPNDPSDYSVGLNVTCPGCINYQHDQVHDYKLQVARTMLVYGPPFPQPNASVMANASYSAPRSIRFDSGIMGEDGGLTDSTMITFFCPVIQQFVETTIRCTFGDCTATRVRPSTTERRNRNATSFDLWGTFALDMISSVSNNKHLQVSSPSELFMNDSVTSPIKGGISQPGVTLTDLSEVDPQTLADRASMLLNTALQIFMAPAGFTGDLPTSNLSIYGIPHIPADGVPVTTAALNGTMLNGGDTGRMTLGPEDLVHSSIISLAPFIAANTTARVTEFSEVYKADYAWVAVLILSSAVLVITGIAGMALSSYVRGPDVWDPLMGLTYNNPHLNIPGHHSTLSATERARLLSGLTVRLGDVQPYNEMGKISLGQMAEVKRLVRGRLYE
jgi:hypothetical protein